MSVFVVTDVADEKVANILDEKFNMSTTMPDNPKSDYYNSSSARIIIIRKSKFPQNPKRSVRFSGKRTKRSVQKRKARNTQKAETKVL